MKRDSDLSNIIGCLYSEMETLGLKPRLSSSVVFPLCLGLKFIFTIDLSILTIKQHTFHFSKTNTQAHIFLTYCSFLNEMLYLIRAFKHAFYFNDA